LKLNKTLLKGEKNKMPDNTHLSRSGQINKTGAVDALFRDQLQAEIITEFHAQQKVKPYVRYKEIEKGKSASFPNVGKVDAKYVFAGETLLGNQKIAHSETTILLDPILVSDVKIPEIDTLMEEYSDREVIKNEMAHALAKTEETQQMIVGCLAARAGGMVEGRAGGSVIKVQGCKIDAEKLAAAIYTAGIVLKEKDVPYEDIVCFLRPAQVGLLAQYDKITDKNLGGSGNYSKGTVGFLNGIQIIETNYLPSSNITKNTSSTDNQANNVYYGDFSNTAGLVMGKGAIGTIVRKGITVETTWLPQELCWLLTARNLQGHGILDPRKAVEIRDEAVSTPTQDTETEDDSQSGS
jgi:hypothetical protein